MDPREPAHLRIQRLIRVHRTSIHSHQARRSGMVGLWLRAQLRLTLLGLLVVSGLLGSLSQGAFQFLMPTASAHGLGKPTSSAAVNVPENTTSVTHSGLGKSTPGTAPAGPPQSLKRTGGITMSPGMLALDATHDTRFMGSDGRLEVDVPAGAVTSGDVAAAGGRISLRISQIAPGSGSSAGGSGIVSLGTYLVQAVDANGVLLTHGLRHPVTLKLHYSSRETALDLTHVRVDFNGTLPVGTSLAPLGPPVQSSGPIHGIGGQINVDGGATPSGAAPTMANSRFNAPSAQGATLDTASSTMMVAYTLQSPSTSLSFNTNSPVATFGSPDPYNVDLNAGSLSSTFQLDVPSGPGGLTPPVQLTYSSAAVSEQHNAQGAAGWVGEGWNLDLGAITWAEHDSNGGCSPTCGNGWEDTWDLSDPFGTSVELIPPNINVSTYFDDGPNVPVTLVQWHSTPENYAKIYSYAGPLTLPDGAGLHPPCFRVFLTNGIMEEFGCTSDSLAYYPSSTGNHDFIAAWHLDLITDPQGNQIHITYNQDTASKSINGVSHSYIRDTVLKAIEWDSPSCDNAQTMCTGSSWAPLMRVSFTVHHNPTRVTRGSHACNTGTNLRCDDPVSVSGGLNAPDVESTFALDDALVQVRSSGTGSWNTLKDYQFSYSQDGPQQIQDPVSGEEVSEAGSFLLTTLKTIGADGSTALPPRTFTYFWNVNFYVDDAYQPTPTTNCGSIAWNTGTGNGCLLWSRSFWSNSYYLWTADNGMGLHQTFTWANARNNTHGVNGGGTTNSLNPFYCNGLTAAQQATYPCSEVDDQNWSRIVLTQQKDDVVQVAAGGNTLISSITHYAYTLTALTARQCSDCTWGMYWGSQNDADHLDFYNSKYMGFAEADVSNPDGSVVKHHYLSTEGYGIYDSTAPCFSPNGYCDSSPWWDLGNAAHGHEYQTDYYDTDGTTPLKRVTNVYQVVCPPSGVSGSPSWSTTIGGIPYTYSWDGNLVAELDHGNPVAVCDVQTKESDTFTFDGVADSDDTTVPYTVVPHSSVSYVYDSMGRVSYQTTGADTGLKVQYFQDDILSALKLTRLEANVNNVWGTGSPFPTIHGNGFSARWTGYVKPQYTGTYTFYTYSDDGVRLYVNGTLVVDNWTDHSPTENSGTIALTAGQLYSIKLEYYEKTGGATMQLSWSEASQPKQIIPAAAFFTRADGGGGSLMGSVPVTVVNTQYIQNNNVTATNTSVTGTYLINFPAATITQDGSGSTHYACSYTDYDGQVWATGQQSTLTLGEATSTDTYTTCSPSGNSGPIRHLYSYDTYGNKLTDIDPDANAGDASHKGCTVGSSTYTSCQTYDATYHVLPKTTTNALNQTVTTGYSTSPSATNGWGFWPISVTDANNAVSATAYDALGRVVSTTAPGETTGLTTTSTSYTVWCTPPGPQGPCIEVDTTQRINSTTTVTSRKFYDGFGRLIETRTPAPSGYDVVQFAQYDAAGHEVFESVPYFVTAYTGNPGGAAFSYPDTTQAGTNATYDGLGRVNTTQNALQQTTNTYYAASCGYVGDAACYEVTTVIDALQHQTQTFTDALGRETYSRTFTGNDTVGHTVYTTSKYAYDPLGDTAQITQPNGSTTTYTFDDAKHTLSMTDPDRGHETYGYDANGNLIQTTDARGDNTYTGYDGLNRQLWRNSSNTSAGAYVTYSYDSGSEGKGRLTGETFSSPTDGSLSGSYSYLYDARGQLTSSTTVLLGTSYTTSTTYDDAGNQLTLTYPDGVKTTTGYSQGWFAGVTLQLGASGPTDTLMNNVSYSAFGTITGATIGSLSGNAIYHYYGQYDALGRETISGFLDASGSIPIVGEEPTYDAAGNVSTLATLVSAGEDQQVFCYDDLNRLIWAGAGAGTNPCGTGTGSSFSGATYSQSFAYDTLGRLTSGPAGSYVYDNATHLHAAVRVGTSPSQYSADYDAAGDMICRAPDSSTTCRGSHTGQQLTYDTEGRLAAWQNAPTSPTTTASYLYDGDGQRVAQKITASGTTTTTSYLGKQEAVTISGSTTTTTDYVYAKGKLIAETVNGIAGGLASISYLFTNYQGSVIAALNRSGGTGGIAASRLYDPYGNVRWSSGAFPTDYGYTGQRADAATGLDYYSARYYDPTVGQFTSADAILPGGGMDVWGLSRYAYVEGNPTTKTDPTGHCPWCIAAIVGAVVGAAAVYGSQVVTNVQHGGSLTDISTWKPTDGGAILKGALVGAVIGATAGAAGTLIMGASTAAAVDTAGTVFSNSVLGAGEGLAQGVENGDGGWDLAVDAAAGSASGIVGGLFGKLVGGVWEYGSRATAEGMSKGSILTGRVIENAAGNGAANFTGQVMSGHGVDGKSFLLSLAVGGLTGHMRGSGGESAGDQFGATAFGFGLDWVTQTVYSGLAKQASVQESRYMRVDRRMGW